MIAMTNDAMREAAAEQGLTAIMDRLSTEGIAHTVAHTGGGMLAVHIGEGERYIAITAADDDSPARWWMGHYDRRAEDWTYVDVCTDDGFTTLEVVTVLRAVVPVLSTMTGDDVRRIALDACVGLLKAQHENVDMARRRGALHEKLVLAIRSYYGLSRAQANAMLDYYQRGDADSIADAERVFTLGTDAR